MNRAARKSSRKRMQFRIGKNKSKQAPSTYIRLNEKQEEVSLYNRAMKHRIIHMSQANKSAPAREEAKNKRKRLLVASRRALRAIRKQTKKLMRAAAGG